MMRANHLDSLNTGVMVRGDFRIGEWLIQPQIHVIRSDAAGVAAPGVQSLTKVEPKAMAVLVYLAEHTDEVVPKEKLIHAVWEGTFVTDDVLTRCIADLRKAFDDDAKNSRVIQTIPRSGYRLLLPLVDVQAPAAAAEPAVAAPRRLARWKILVPAAFVVIAAIVGGTFYFRSAPALTEKDTILLADFVNTTGDVVFDGTLKQALSIQLAQSPFLNLLPEERVRQTLRLMNRPPEERVVGPVAREVCQRQNVKALLVGEIAPLGSHYVLTLDAMNCATGDSLAKEQVEATSKEEVLSALGKSVSRLRRKLGESLASVEKLDKPFEEATTTSLDALKQFTLGVETQFSGREREAIPYFERAIELDPTFAQAYRRLGVMYRNAREGEKSREYFTKAFELRNRVSERERLDISGSYYFAVTGELEKARETYELYIRSYPRGQIPWNILGVVLNRYGEYDKAAEHFREALSRNPNVAVAYENLSYSFLALGRVEEAKAVLEQQIARGIETMTAHTALYTIAFLQNDPAAMQRHSDWARGKPDEHWMLNTQAEAAAYLGKRKGSLELRRRAVEMARQKGQLEPAANYLANAALNESRIGNCSQARQQIEAALSLHRQGAENNAPYVFARCGDVSRALNLADELVKRFPLGTLVNNVTVPEVRAIVETHRGNPAKAIELLRSAEPFEKGAIFEDRQRQLGATYTRGIACLKSKSGKEAAAEFEKVLSRRSISPRNLLHALSYLQLGRAYAIAAETEKARKAYQDFLALWKDADPDIPVLREAKAEYARLK